MTATVGRRLRTFAVPIAAIAAMLGSGAWMVVQGQGVGSWSARSVGGAAYGMMGEARLGGLASSGDRTPVVDLAGARDRAQAFATSLEPSLTVGEVMQFEQHYYAELVDADADGSLATEVLIDPVAGDVQVELGPARMWNTRYGMMARGAPDARISATDAQRIADEWLAERAGGEGRTAAAADAFPGYYTLHTLRDGKVDGMLSVNSTSGDVWYHSWHGAFVTMSEAP